MTVRKPAEAATIDAAAGRPRAGHKECAACPQLGYGKTRPLCMPNQPKVSVQFLLCHMQAAAGDMMLCKYV